MGERESIDIFVARQPIFGVGQEVYGYELFFRSGPENLFPDLDPDLASSRMILDNASVFGTHSLTEGKKAFVNMTQRMLTEELFTTLPPDFVVLEILETVEPDEEVISACERAKKAGYLLALDDFVYHPDLEPLIELADFIKIDFLQHDRQAREELAARLGGSARLIAERVETFDHLRAAVDLGFDYFQGFYFSEPQMISRQEIPAFKATYLRLIQEINEPGLDVNRLEELIEQDVSLTIRLLRLLNMASLGFRGRADSVRQALVFLGERPVKKWATLLALAELGDDKPRELIKTCLVRARFCELLAPAASLRSQSHDLFLVGMLSLVDTLVGRPLAEVIAELAVSEEIHAGVLEEGSPLGRVRSLVVGYERGSWDHVARFADDLGIPEGALPGLYAQAVEWAYEIFAV